ncbi:Agamous-like MADS-box protein AGL80 [Cardamine amara subsp. amara]|uniref:Agamous-like MADS-box protein AGL80 n=1 Tax=Cardamine amara subsp. amara TaxID=228776 RepID=A0ABD1AD33_CARAN
MTRKKVRLAWVGNSNSRTVSLKKRRLGLSKKVKELTILCDVKAFIIMFSPNEAEPMVWPSVEVARDLLRYFFALPEFERKKKETNLQSYLKEKTMKVQDQLRRSQKKIMEYLADQLMVQLQHGGRIDDLSMSEIYALLSYSKAKIMVFRKRLNFMQDPPLRDPPVPAFELEFEEFRIITNGIFEEGSQNDERARKTDGAGRWINFDTLSDNQSHYLLDQWVFASEPPTYQGSSSNGNPNLEMEPIGPQGIIFHDLVGSVSQPLQPYGMEDNSIMARSQPMQYHIDFMSHDLGVQGEGSNINNGDSQFHRSITISTNNGLREEPPPNETTAREDNVDAMSFDINKVWSGLNNHHF